MTRIDPTHGGADTRGGALTHNTPPRYDTPLDAALDYASRGWPVFPCHSWRDDACTCGRTDCTSPAKHPRTPAGCKDATTDPDTIRRWWNRWPDANVAVATGHCVDVIDADDFEAVDHLDAMGIRGPMVLTARGAHIYVSSAARKNGAHLGGRAIDYRGRGGYVIAPPSTHASGTRYEWVEGYGPDTALMAAPDDLWPTVTPHDAATLPIPQVAPSERYAAAALAAETDAVRRAPEGTRNHRLNIAAVSLGSLVAAGALTENEVVNALTDAALAAGLGEAETRATIQSGMAYGAQSPRTIPDRPPMRGLDADADADVEHVTIPSSWSDAHVADALADHLRGSWLYVAAWGRWMRWDGRRWVRDPEGVYEVSRQWAIELVVAVARTGASQSDIGSAAAYRNRSRLTAIVEMARRIDGIAADTDDFDADPSALCVANGIVDLSTGTLSPHDPDRRMTKLADADYRPDATHPDVDALRAVVAEDVEPWLRRLMGYAATGHTSEDVVPVFDGAGANGKSTLLEALGAVLGDYAGPASPKLIMRSGHDEHPTVIADLLGRRLVWLSETEEGGSFRLESLKALTGGDRLKGRYMRADYFDFAPTHTLVIATNHRPAVNSTEHAAWRRLRLVPFPWAYRPANECKGDDRPMDRGLRRRLATGHAQRSAVLAWVVAGAIEWHRDGLGECETVTEATREWREHEDVILRFARECLDFAPGASVRGRDLYDCYREWCRDEGRAPKSNKNFVGDLTTHEVYTSHHVRRTTPGRVAIYHGVGLASQPFIHAAK